jgi:hypothetical protein
MSNQTNDPCLTLGEALSRLGEYCSKHKLSPLAIALSTEFLSSLPWGEINDEVPTWHMEDIIIDQLIAMLHGMRGVGINSNDIYMRAIIQCHKETED